MCAYMESSRSKKVNHGGKKVTMKELLADRARIDAAMEQVEAAKAKSKAQRAEYAKYLAWKVDLQRKERKAREAEDAAMRDRVEEKLRQVLKEHREQAHRDRTQWSSYTETKVPKRRPPRLSNAIKEDEEYAKSVLEAKHQHYENSTNAFRASLPPKSAPPTSLQARQPRRPPPTKGANGEVVHSPSGRSALAAQILERSAETGELDMDAVAVLRELPPLTTTTVAVAIHDDHSGDEGSGALTAQGPGASPDARRRRRLQIGSRRHLGAVTDMYEKARTRRLYATGRMLADPPADYLMGSDILRYIPAEVLQDEDAPPAAVGGGPTDTVFLTQDTDLKAPDVTDADPREQRTVDGGLRTSGVDHSPNTGQKLKWKKWDPNAWMKLPDAKSLKLVETRQPDEEQATLEWYRTYHEQYTRVKKRTEHHGQRYSWKQKESHALPPPKSLRFDQN